MPLRVSVGHLENFSKIEKVRIGTSRDMGPPGRISLVKWGPQGSLKWGSPSEMGPTHACWQSASNSYVSSPTQPSKST